MEASFIKRLLAYCIDIFIISLAFTIISSSINTTKVDKLNREIEEIMTKTMTGEIESTKSLNELSKKYYEMEKSSMTTNIIYAGLLIVYFIGFQYLNKGQTIGKKVLKIKVIENDKEPSLKGIVLRTIFIYDILINLVLVLSVLFLKRKSFFTIYMIMSLINSIFIYASAIMILYRKDKKGLQDIISNTKVVEV